MKMSFLFFTCKFTSTRNSNAECGNLLYSIVGIVGVVLKKLAGTLLRWLSTLFFAIPAGLVF